MKIRAGIAMPNVNQVQRVKAKNIYLVEETSDEVHVPCSVSTVCKGVSGSVTILISIPVWVVVEFSMPLSIVTSSIRLSW